MWALHHGFFSDESTWSDIILQIWISFLAWGKLITWLKSVHTFLEGEPMRWYNGTMFGLGMGNGQNQLRAHLQLWKFTGWFRKASCFLSTKFASQCCCGWDNKETGAVYILSWAPVQRKNMTLINKIKELCGFYILFSVTVTFIKWSTVQEQ